MRDILRKPYLYAGSLVVAVVAWAFVTVGGAIANGHPSYWIAYGLALAIGVASMILAWVWASDPTRVVLASVGAVMLVLVAGVMWWLTPFEATDTALEAMESDDAVIIESSTSEITMAPTGTGTGTGLIFQPGARVDARAYAHLLRPVAEAGHDVVIVKQPLGVAFLAPGAAPGWASAHPETERWVVAGHSLGGVVAAQNASDGNDIDDLILWASYPATDMSGDGFAAVSIFGTNDGLTTVDQIEDSRSELPAQTVFIAIEGGIHSHFGDYGEQPGDGEPGVQRDTAQALIVSATLEFLSD